MEGDCVNPPQKEQFFVDFTECPHCGSDDTSLRIS